MSSSSSYLRRARRAIISTVVTGALAATFLVGSAAPVAVAEVSSAAAAATRTISGTVTLPEGADPAWMDQITVNANLPSGNGNGHAVPDAETGEYTISGLPLGAYRVSFLVSRWSGAGSVPPNLVSEYWDSQHSWYEADLVDVTNGDRADIDASLEEGRSISGTVTLPVGADPAWMRGISVGASTVDGSSNGSAQPDPETGRFSITGLLPGSYRVQFSAYSSWNTGPEPINIVREYYDGAADYTSAKLVDISATDADGVDASLDLGRTISGTVALPVGAKPGWMQSVSVRASSETYFSSSEARPDPETGRYTIVGLSHEEHRVSFEVQPYSYQGTDQVNLLPEYYDDAENWADSRPVDLGAQDATGIDAELALGRTIAGKVSLPAGADPSWMSYVTATPVSSWNSHTISRVDSTTGDYLVTGLRPGSYAMRFGISANAGPDAPNLAQEYYDDATLKSHSTPVDVSSGNRNGVDASLATGRSISGFVALPPGIPRARLADVNVAVYDADGEHVRTVNGVDPDTGAYTVRSLAAGEYRVSVAAYGSSDTPDLPATFFGSSAFLDGAVPISTVDGDASRVDIILETAGHLSGTLDLSALREAGGSGYSVSVTDASGTLVQGRWGDGIEWAEASTLNIGAVKPGSYRIAVSTTDWDESTGSSIPRSTQYLRDGTTSLFTVRSDQTLDLDLVAQVPSATMSGTMHTPTTDGATAGVVASALPYERIDGAWVRLADARFDGPVGSSTPFEVRVPPGTFTVGFETDFADDESLVPEQWWNGARTLSEATPIILTGGQNRSGIDGDLRRLGEDPEDGAVTAPGGFVSLEPSRLLDTRNGTGAPARTIAPNQTIELQVTGRGGVPATGVSAVVMNTTVTAPTAAGFITAYPTGTAQPTASNLNFTRDQTIPNLVTLKVGTNGKVSFTNTSAGTVHLIADVAGYYLDGAVTAPGGFVSLEPSRLLDTRNGTGAPARTIAPNQTIELQVTGRGGVPATGVSAVVMNTTVTAPTAAGFITAYPTGTAQPTASNLNFTRDQTIPNLITLKVGTNGKVSFTNTSAGTVHLIADVAGYYLDGAVTAPGGFVSLEPSRLLDTRNGTGAPARTIAPNQTIELQVTGRGGVPATGVSAVVMNTTVTAPTAAGFITAYPTGTAQPTASNLNFTRDQTIPNLITLKVGTDGKVSFTNTSAGTVHLIADVAGYYLSGTGTGG